MRSLNAKIRREYRPGTYSGYFDVANIDALLASLSNIEYAKGIYFTPNPVKAALLARSSHHARMVRDGEPSTTDGDVAHRRWLLIDVDPVRPAGISATPSEKAAAEAVRDGIAGDLWTAGLPRGIIADSGNGAHLMLPCQHSNDELSKQFHQTFLGFLAEKYNTPRATVDLTTFNAGRIWKLYGTLSCKGDNCPEIGREWRPSRIVIDGRYLPRPGEIPIISENMAAVAATCGFTWPPAPAAARSSPRAPPRQQRQQQAQQQAGEGGNEHQRPIVEMQGRLLAFLESHGVAHGERQQRADGTTMYRLAVCPFDSNHGRDAAVFEAPDGQLGFYCFHNGCSEHRWRDFRLAYEPTAYDDSHSLPRHCQSHSIGGVPDLVIESTRTSNTLTQLIARVAGRPAHVDKIDLTKADARAKFAKRLATSSDRIDVSAVSDTLLQIAEERASQRRDDDGDWGQAGPDDVPPSLQIVQFLESAVGDELLVELAWEEDARQRTATVPYRMIGEVRSITALRSFGLPLTSDSAPRWVRFFSQYIEEHKGEIPRAHYANRLGWQGSPESLVFLAGPTVEQAIISATGEGQARSVPVFRAGDDGTEQSVAGFRESGRAEVWRAFMAALAQFPRMQLAVHASLAPPLLSIVKAPGFVVSFAGESSRGKTTALIAAASAWGQPRTDGGESVMHTWNVTRTFLDRLGGARGNTPMILDDTSLCDHPALVTQFVYDLAGGQGRGRGRIEGLQQTMNWRTVLLTSGESSVLSHNTTKNGAGARVLELWGSPLEDVNADAGELAAILRDNLGEHYGHAGPAWVRYLIEQTAEWDAWRERYAAWRTYFRRQAGDNPILGRLAEPLAVLALVAELSRRAEIVAWEDIPVQTLYNEFRSQTTESDTPSRALKAIYECVVSRIAEFSGAERLGLDAGQSHARNYLGRLDTTGLAILPETLKGWLRELGYGTQDVVQIWEDREWLLKDVPRGNPKVHLGTQRVRCVVIRREKLDQVCGLADTAVSLSGPACLAAHPACETGTTPAPRS